ncbi:Beta-porphyranase B precursor [Rubripirellula obstinata]|uniref:Beta-porphyranase B n=1 Tax=Rubripirellula obstinata TaxID=406547 RepID=A0A5B1CKQ8_9BACT|nr:family 16 glycosylhydrolase [Rubripirellula obstinata]KAA1261136.1 Beta-porphyranase B precursor [Rubripirellula obstinata]
MINATRTKFAFLLLVSISTTFCESAHSQSTAPQDVPPEPPDGYQWVKNDAFSDEFNGTELDQDKWHDHHPSWVGRPPGKFMPSNVSVRDGYLQIKSTVLDPPQGDFSIACGAVQSKSQEALYGYYECRMKASSVSTSSTFWLAGKPKPVPGGTLRLELDIQESIGDAQRWEGFKTRMNSNTHITFLAEKQAAGSEQDKTAEPEPKTAKKGDHVKLKSNVNEEFHTYGCWWIDANSMKFYADGKYAFTITPSTELDPTPFDHPLFMNLVCETYSWETPPTHEDLADDSRNTTYYDWVRSYKLVKLTQ